MAPNGGPGLVYRTADTTVKFQAGHKYKASFDYQNSQDGQYAWVSGYDTPTGPSITGRQDIGKKTDTTRFEQQFTAGSCGSYFVGLERTAAAEGSNFTLDNVLIEDLGASTEVPACATVSGTLGADVIQQGKATDFTTVLNSTEPAPISGVEVKLALPEGWTATADDASTAAALPAGGSLTTKWKITAPADADGSSQIGITGTYSTTTAPAGARTVTGSTSVKTLPKAPQGTVFASDHEWVSASNGWGPVEKDLANGEAGAGDGPPLTLNGVEYTKGLGAHAPSTIRYFLGGYCTRFTAAVGVDDAQATRGSVTFSVVADGRNLVTTPVLGPTSDTVNLDVNVSGAQYVDLVAGTTADGNGNDHADWADAKFTCSSTATVPPVTPPAGDLSGTVFASDLPWVSSTNGSGPAERDMANGESAAGDGPAIKLDGVSYTKGIGAHADSSVRINT